MPCFNARARSAHHSLLSLGESVAASSEPDDGFGQDDTGGSDGTKHGVDADRLESVSFNGTMCWGNSPRSSPMACPRSEQAC